MSTEPAYQMGLLQQMAWGLVGTSYLGYPLNVGEYGTMAIPFASTQVDLAHVQSEVERANIFIEHIQHIHQQVHDILDRANAKYKQCDDQHWVPHKF